MHFFVRKTEQKHKLFLEYDRLSHSFVDTSSGAEVPNEIFVFGSRLTEGSRKKIPPLMSRPLKRGNGNDNRQELNSDHTSLAAGFFIGLV